MKFKQNYKPNLKQFQNKILKDMFTDNQLQYFYLVIK